jgi:hypothetical protein
MKAAAGPTSCQRPELAAQAIRAGLVDEFHLFPTPILGGATALPDGVRLQLNCWTSADSTTARFTSTTA